MQIFRSKFRETQGLDYKVIYKTAYASYKLLVTNPRRSPYVRSCYFGKEKIFLEVFWIHLSQKSWRDRKRRLKYFSCAIDLIKNSLSDPVSVIEVKDKKSILYRFSGFSNSGKLFCVQIKHDKKSDRKWLISVFPEND